MSRDGRNAVQSKVKYGDGCRSADRCDAVDASNSSSLLAPSRDTASRTCQYSTAWRRRSANCLEVSIVITSDGASRTRTDSRVIGRSESRGSATDYDVVRNPGSEEGAEIKTLQPERIVIAAIAKEQRSAKLSRVHAHARGILVMRRATLK